MIRTRLLRRLDLCPDDASVPARHLSAASGLVALGPWLYVVADDANDLAVFPASGDAGGTLRCMFDAALPASPAARKAHKADFEILLHVPGFGAHGVLLALGSGSTARRERGAWFALDADGTLQDDAHVLDIAPLYAQLRAAFPALNLEGAAIVRNEFILLQRASRVDPRNALLRLPLDVLMQALASGTFAAPDNAAAIDVVDLGERNGVPWSFTDAAALDDGRLVFSAVVEDTDDTYRDGPCLGSAIGCLLPEGRLEWLKPLDVQAKVEGIDVRRAGDLLLLRMVTDADDADVPAQLLEARIDLAAAPD